MIPWLMNPWLWQYAPQFHLPLSGAVTQDISPETFFGSIATEAGNGRIEKEIFQQVASYGRQLGLISEVLLSREGSGIIDQTKAQESLTRLKEIYEKTEKLKSENKEKIVDTAIKLLEELKSTDSDALRDVLCRFDSAHTN